MLSMPKESTLHSEVVLRIEKELNDYQTVSDYNFDTLTYLVNFKITDWSITQPPEIEDIDEPMIVCQSNDQNSVSSIPVDTEFENFKNMEKIHKNYVEENEYGYKIRYVPIEIKARVVPHLYRAVLEIDYKNISNDVAWVHGYFSNHANSVCCYDAEKSFIFLNFIKLLIHIFI